MIKAKEAKKLGENGFTVKWLNMNAMLVTW
jgi:hypothetical protein